ncbi:MAG: hypothetical protein RI885_272 [Actinomycetota bacterium]
MTDPMSTADIQSKVAQTRAQLENTLDEIEDKLNVPKQLGIAAKRARAAYENDPAPWIAGVGAAVAVVGGIVVWAVTARK